MSLSCANGAWNWGRKACGGESLPAQVKANRELLEQRMSHF